MLSSRYIGRYEFNKRLNSITYPLDMPVELKHIHNMFYISQLKKYIPNPAHTIIINAIEIIEDLMYGEHRV